MAILILAAVLRFAGIAWGLRHQPHSDERVFVENTAAMVAAGDLDHLYYEYPGLFFYLLAPALWAVHAFPEPGVRGYLAARGIVDLFGILDVALVYVLGRKIGGPTLGLVAALFLAVSPLDVFTAQTARPDIVVQAFATLALLATLGVGAGVGSDLKAGLAVGAAAAVKFSGLLAFAPFAVRRLTTAGPRVKGLVLAGVCTAGVLLLSMTAALRHTAALRSGVGDQWGYHFSGGMGQHVGGILLFFLGVLWQNMGPLFCLLAAAGSFFGMRAQGPMVLPLVAFVATTFAVHSLAHARYLRFLVPAMGALCVLAALGTVQASRRLRLPVAVLALLAAALPLWLSALDARRVSSPHPLDRILDAIESSAQPGAVVFIDAPGLGIDRSRYRVIDASGDAGLDRWALRLSDLAVLQPRSFPLVTNGGPVAEAADDAIALPLTRMVRLSTTGRPVFHPAPAVSSPAGATDDGRSSVVAFAEARSIARVRVPGARRIPTDGRFVLSWSPDAEGDTWRPVKALVVPALSGGSGDDADAAFLFEPLGARRLRLRVSLGPKRTAPSIVADEARTQ